MKYDIAQIQELELKNCLMIDVEALRLQQPWKAPLMQVGICVFDAMGKALGSDKMCIHPELLPTWAEPEASTLKWWAEDDKAEVWSQIQEEMVVHGKTPREVMEWINEVYQAWDCKSVWFAGPQYDKIIIDVYQADTNVKPAWDYNDVRCFRTIRKQHPDVLQDWQGCYNHNAEQDAIDQVHRLRAITEAKGVVWL